MDLLKFLKELSFCPNREHWDRLQRCVEGIGEDSDFQVVRIFLIVVDSIVRICPDIRPISGYIWVSGSFVREMAYFPDYWGQLVEGGDLVAGVGICAVIPLTGG